MGYHLYWTWLSSSEATGERDPIRRKPVRAHSQRSLWEMYIHTSGTFSLFEVMAKQATMVCDYHCQARQHPHIQGHMHLQVLQHDPPRLHADPPHLHTLRFRYSPLH